MSEQQAVSTAETPVGKIEFGLGGILIGVAFIVLVVFTLNYFKIINLPFSLPQNQQNSQVGGKISSSLVSKYKTIADVNASMPVGKEITSPINVSSNLQAEFQKLHPNQKILYIGPNNVGPKDSLIGNELNDSIVTVGGTNGDSLVNFPFFGGGQPTLTDKGTTVFGKIVMEFKDIILIPNSEDFYAHGIDPQDNNADIYVRIVGEGKDQTELLCLNLNDKDGFDYGDSPNFDKSKHMVSNVALDKFFILGDTLEIFTQANAVHLGSIWTLTFKTDSKGIQSAAKAGIIRFYGADKISGLFN